MDAPYSAQEARSRKPMSIYIAPTPSRLDATTAAEHSRFSPDTPSPPPETESPPRLSFATTFTRHSRERSRDQAYRSSPPRSQRQLSREAGSTKSGKQPSPSSSPEHVPSQLPFPSLKSTSMSSAQPSSFYTNAANARSSPGSIGAGSRSTSSTRASGKLGKLFANVRMWGSKEPDIMIPIHPPQHNWPPLHVEKQCTTCACNDPKRRRKRRVWIVLLVVLLLFLVGNTIALNIRVVNLTSNGRTPGWTGKLSSDQAECLSQFTLNAPTDPTEYPCSTCLSPLSQVPPEYASSNPSDAQDVQNAIQFCGLKAIFDSADGDGKATLNGTRWLNDVRFCTWGGVTCSGSGMVSSLELTFPAVPGIIPTEFGSLTGLQSLKITGNGDIPAGDFPSSLKSLTALSTLQLESTGMNALPDDLFSSLKSVSTLLLSENSKFAGGLPSSIGLSSLQSLVIAQPLSSSLDNILSSTTLQKSLRLLSITSASLSTSIPSSIASFSSLIELHLDNNNLQPSLPPAFPPSLQILTLANNTALSGSLPSSLCSSTALRTCDMRQTGLGQGGPCGPCQF